MIKVSLHCLAPEFYLNPLKIPITYAHNSKIITAGDTRVHSPPSGTASNVKTTLQATFSITVNGKF